MGFRLGTPADFDQGDDVGRTDDDRYRMAEIALEPDRFVLGIQVIAVMAAKASGGIGVADVVGVCVPVDALLAENTLIVDVLQGSDGSIDQILVVRVELGMGRVVVASQTRDRARCLRVGFIVAVEDFNRHPADLGNCG